MLHQIIKGIKNLIKWFPVIWRDRDWDHHYIYILLYYKLKHMEKFFKSDEAYSLKAPKVAKELMIVKNLCKRLSEYDYLENATMWHDKKFEERNIDEWFRPLNDGSGMSIYIDDTNVERRESFRRCCNHSDKMRKQDLNYLLLYINKNIEKWWD